MEEEPKLLEELDPVSDDPHAALDVGLGGIALASAYWCARKEGRSSSGSCFFAMAVLRGAREAAGPLAVGGEAKLGTSGRKRRRGARETKSCILGM